MWNLSQVFSDSAQRATLLTALLSTVVAVVIVLLSHWLAQRRSSAELRIKKLEETYDAVAQFANAGARLMTEMVSGPPPTSELRDAFSEAYAKAEMLCAIYAPELLRLNEVLKLIVIHSEDPNVSDSLTQRLESLKKAKEQMHGVLIARIRKMA